MKRESRLTADITEPTHNLLREACVTYDSSKGKLLEKMIKNFLGADNEQSEPKAVKPKAPKAARKKVEYPSNLDEQFLLLWETKGKKGAKQKAYDKFRSLMADNNDEICEQATMIMIADINKNKGECGYPELHLTTYLNQARWDK